MPFHNRFSKVRLAYNARPIDSTNVRTHADARETETRNVTAPDADQTETKTQSQKRARVTFIIMKCLH